METTLRSNHELTVVPLGSRKKSYRNVSMRHLRDLLRETYPDSKVSGNSYRFVSGIWPAGGTKRLDVSGRHLLKSRTLFQHACKESQLCNECPDSCSITDLSSLCSISLCTNASLGLVPCGQALKRALRSGIVTLPPQTESAI